MKKTNGRNFVSQFLKGPEIMFVRKFPAQLAKMSVAELLQEDAAARKHSRETRAGDIALNAIVDISRALKEAEKREADQKIVRLAEIDDSIKNLRRQLRVSGGVDETVSNALLSALDLRDEVAKA